MLFSETKGSTRQSAATRETSSASGAGSVPIRRSKRAPRRCPATGASNRTRCRFFRKKNIKSPSEIFTAKEKSVFSCQGSPTENPEQTAQHRSDKSVGVRRLCAGNLISKQTLRTRRPKTKSLNQRARKKNRERKGRGIRRGVTGKERQTRNARVAANRPYRLD